MGHVCTAFSTKTFGTEGVGLNRLTAIGFRREQKLSLIFFPLEGFSTKKFAVGVSRWSYFLE